MTESGDYLQVLMQQKLNAECVLQLESVRQNES